MSWACESCEATSIWLLTTRREKTLDLPTICLLPKLRVASLSVQTSLTCSSGGHHESSVNEVYLPVCLLVILTYCAEHMADLQTIQPPRRLDANCLLEILLLHFSRPGGATETCTRYPHSSSQRSSAAQHWPSPLQVRTTPFHPGYLTA